MQSSSYLIETIVSHADKNFDDTEGTICPRLMSQKIFYLMLTDCVHLKGIMAI